MNSIHRIAAQSVSQAYTQGADAAQTSAGQAAAKAGRHHRNAPKTDSVTLSDDARSLAAARDAVKQAPDMRDDKVADIKQRVTDGTYSVSSRALARKMVETSKNPS